MGLFDVWTILAILLLGVPLVAYLLGMYRYIPNNRVGVVEKMSSASGSVQHGILALKGEAGYQPHVLRGGMHFFFPLQFRVHILPLVTIPQGSIGYLAH